MPILRRALIIILVLLLSACSDGPRLEPLPGDSIVLAFGDSLTYGTGAPRDQSYPSHLERLIGRTVINAGVPGEVSAEGRQRLPALLDRHQPALLLLCHGGNDLLRKKDRQALQENLAAMVEMARERGISVVLLGVPEPTLFLREAPAFYAKTAERFALPYEGEIIPTVESDDDLKSDAVHPNAEGYRQIADAIAELLRDAGAI